MVHVSYRFLREVRQSDPAGSLLDLKALFRADTYVTETIHMLPEKPEPIVLAQIFNKVAGIGRMHAVQLSLSPGSWAKVLTEASGFRKDPRECHCSRSHVTSEMVCPSHFKSTWTASAPSIDTRHFSSMTEEETGERSAVSLGVVTTGS
jgi:hypothetical protein